MHRRTDNASAETPTGATKTQTMKKSSTAGPRPLHPTTKPGKQGKLSKPKGKTEGDKEEGPHVEKYGG